MTFHFAYYQSAHHVPRVNINCTNCHDFLTISLCQLSQKKTDKIVQLCYLLFVIILHGAFIPFIQLWKCYTNLFQNIINKQSINGEAICKINLSKILNIVLPLLSTKFEYHIKILGLDNQKATDLGLWIHMLLQLLSCSAYKKENKLIANYSKTC